MSTYNDMWEKIKNISPEERKEWLTKVNPPVGRALDFEGVEVFDVDLAEALDYMIEEYDNRAKRIAIFTPHIMRSPN